MKNFTYLATALLVLAGAAGCKKNADVQEPEKQSSGRMIPFTVTAGQGGQKTSVSGKALVWDSGDQITVMKQDGTYPTTLTLKGDGGSASGEFDGEISEDVADGAELIGLYGVNYSGGTYSVTVPASQTYAEGSFQAGIFPSIGSGTYVKNGATQLTFSTNPLGILRVTVKGADDETLTSVSLKSFNSSKKLAGSFTLTSGTWAVSGGETDEITMNCGDVTLSESGVQLNFVVPTFTFASGELRVQAIINKNGTAGKKYTETNSSEVAITANNVTKIERTILLLQDVQNNWYDVCKIGSKYWMAENLHCSQYSSNLTSPEYDSDKIIGKSIEFTEKYRYMPAYSESTISGGGYLYNDAAAVGVRNSKNIPETYNVNDRQGICPDGWRIPTEDDFTALVNRIELTDGKGKNTAGKYLKNETSWKTSSGIENLNGFAALGTGVLKNYGGYASIQEVGERTEFYPSTFISDNKRFVLLYNINGRVDDTRVVSRGDDYRISVRCIKK